MSHFPDLDELPDPIPDIATTGTTHIPVSGGMDADFLARERELLGNDADLFQDTTVPVSSASGGDLVGFPDFSNSFQADIPMSSTAIVTNNSGLDALATQFPPVEALTPVCVFLYLERRGDPCLASIDSSSDAYGIVILKSTCE